MTSEHVRIRVFSKQWFENLINNEATSGLIMIFAMIAAIVCANTSAREPVAHFLETPGNPRRRNGDVHEID